MYCDCCGTNSVRTSDGGTYHPCRMEPLPREVPYVELPPAEIFEQPVGEYGPHRWELLDWRQDGENWTAEYRGQLLRIRPSNWEDRSGREREGWRAVTFHHSLRGAMREAVEDADWTLDEWPLIREARQKEEQIARERVNC